MIIKSFDTKKASEETDFFCPLFQNTITQKKEKLF